jgi:hypothetical protein
MGAFWTYFLDFFGLASPARTEAVSLRTNRRPSLYRVR